LKTSRRFKRWLEDDPVPELRNTRSKTLDRIIETLIMLQTDNSVRNAAEADVVITPLFAASSWRDIHLADHFNAASGPSWLATRQQSFREIGTASSSSFALSRPSAT
jgi:hypothetical protein